MTSTIAHTAAVFEYVDASAFPVAINSALADCERAHHLLLTMKNDLAEISTDSSQSLESTYVDVSLQVNEALQSSIRGIGHGGNLLTRLRRMLTDEQKNEVAGDLHQMQREMLHTYASCQAADQTLWRSLRRNLREDPVLHDDPIAIQCLDAIEDHASQLQLLSSTSETLDERSLMIDSMRSHITVLEERAQRLSPTGPFAKILKVFRKAYTTMNHMFQSVLKAFQYRLVF